MHNLTTFTPQTAAEIRWLRAQEAQTTWARTQDLLHAVSEDRIVNSPEARMARVARDGEYDRTSAGLIRNRRGVIGGEEMVAQVQSDRGDVLIEFWSPARKHTRRVLSTAEGRQYIETDGGRCVPLRNDNKYHAPAAAILRARRAA